MRAQRLPDVGPYNGRGVYNPDSWPAPTEYIGQDGTILYCDKKGNVYDSNGVRYGKREGSGLLRKLNKSEQLYDAAFSPNYADEAFKAEERKFENDNKSKKITKSSFDDEIKQTGEADVQKRQVGQSRIIILKICWQKPETSFLLFLMDKLSLAVFAVASIRIP